MTDELKNILQADDGFIDYLNRMTTVTVLHNIYTAIAEGKESISVADGVGCVEINWSDGKVRFNYTPSSDLINGIDKVMNEGIDPLTEQVEDKINNTIVNLYKELF